MHALTGDRLRLPLDHDAARVSPVTRARSPIRC